MNYYEHHLGDWAAATGHLTWDEDMAYTRLLRAYYHAERAIPDGQQYRLAKASTPAQRKSVDTVLAEFFALEDGAYHQKRADAEIEKYRAGEPEREAKKANEDARMKRHREERAKLFQELAAAGQHAAWNVSMNDLRALVKRYCSPLPATAPATPATATQHHTHTHTQSLNPTPTPNPGPSTHTEPTPPPLRVSDPPPDAIPTDAGRICRAMKAEGIADPNPGHAGLLALIEAGATDAEFVGAAKTAVGKKRGFAYAVGIVTGQRTDAAQASKAMHRGPMPQPPMTPAEARMAAAVPGLLSPHLRPAAQPLTEVFDVTPAALGR